MEDKKQSRRKFFLYHGITCPCYGSKFDGSGKVTHDPAKRDLAAFWSVLDGTSITIKEPATITRA